MTSKTQQSQRYVNMISQQLEILNGEKQSVLETLDCSINKVLGEVNAWVNGGHVNHTTYAEMNSRIQQLINLFMAKSAEISEMEDNKNDLFQSISANGINAAVPETSYAREEVQDKVTLSREGIGQTSGELSSNLTSLRLTKLEESVVSLKKTTEQIQEKQVNVKQKLETLTNENFNFKKKFRERLTVLEKRSKEMSSNVNDLFETVTNIDDKLNRLEEENKSVNVSMNELNEQISSVRTCSNDALMSIQDLSKSVESTNQHYNEMSNKMNQLEISINLMSTQYTEQFENFSSHIKNKTDDLIGMFCHLLAKRLTPLQQLNDTLNKKANFSERELSEKHSIENRVAEMSNKITDLELTCNLPKVGFFALKVYLQSEGLGTIKSYNEVCTNHGDHFDPSTGIFIAPLNGLYPITIMTGNSSNTKTNTINCYQIRKDTYVKRIFFHRVSINRTVTRCAEIAAGDKLHLNWEITDRNDETSINVTFSCYLIQKSQSSAML